LSQERYGHDIADESIWKPLPKSFKGIAGIILAAVFIMVAAGSGLGGGGILVPLYISFLDLNPMHAVALSNTTILGSSLMNVIINSRRKHPMANRKMINWEVVLLMEPASILGTVVGGLLNKTFPVWLSMLLMIIFLTATTVRTYRKAIKLYAIESESPAAHERRPLASPEPQNALSEPLHLSPSEYFLSPKETELAAQRSLSLLDESVDERSLLLSPPLHGYMDTIAEAEDIRNDSIRYTHAKEARNKELISIYDRESRAFQYSAIVPMIVLQAVVIVLFIVKKIVACGSAQFWLITFSFVPIVGLFVAFVGRALSRVHLERVANGYEFVAGDIKWNRKMMMWYPPISVFAGVIASWFGVGGGTVKGPLLMELGLLPEVTAATSSTMMLFTTVSAVSGYIAMSRVLVYYGILMFSISTLCTLCAQLALKKIINRFQRPSLVIFLFATICLLGVFGMIFTSRKEMVDIFHGHVEGFRSICSSANK